jgi:hypothetical protein
VKFFDFEDKEYNEIIGRKSKLSIRQASLRPGYFSKQLSVPEGIGIAAEFKGKK